MINYREESIVERLKALTDGKKVAVVYDSVGKDTWEASLDCLQRRGLMVSFGNSSGPVTGVNLGILNQKGSCTSLAHRCRAISPTGKNWRKPAVNCFR